MNSMLSTWKSRDFLVVILFLQLVVYATVFFDVPVARQVIGFIYFTFVPGFVITKLLKLDELDGLETVLFPVALSVAFLMLAGLLINEFCFLFGFSKPLSLIPLMIILNSLVLIGGVLVYLRSEDVKLFRAPIFRLPPLALVLIGLPILSVLGAMWVNVYEKNSILLFMIIGIALLFVLGLISKKALPPKLYPLAILMIAVSLLYHSSLISSYLVTFGSDNHLEYSVFKIAESNAHWSSAISVGGQSFGRVNSMLSVTVLPAVYSILLDMEATWVFKILYPLIFSFASLALYQLWQKNLGEKRAFIATFLFMAQNTFYTEMLGLNRQMVAELFFALLLLVVLNKKMKPFNKTICFMIFSVALVTSHYALAEFFMLFLSIACISLIALKRPSRNITIAMVLFFFVVMFTWYLYTSNRSVFDSFVSFGNDVYDQLGEFSNPESRGQTVLRGLGLESPPTIWNTFSRAFAYLTEFFILLGFVVLITKWVNVRREREYFTLTTIAMAFLVALIAVPGLANTMNMTRFYHMLLFFLAPLCVLGAEFVGKLMSKRQTELWASILLLVVLVPYLLFQIGFVYEVTGTESWSLPLSKHRMDPVFLRYSMGYFDKFEVDGALWMSKNVNVENSKIYADGISIDSVLFTYGITYRGHDYELSNTTIVGPNSTVYLSTLNVVYGKIVYGDHLGNSSELSFLNNINKVYSNGGTEIYVNFANVRD